MGAGGLDGAAGAGAAGEVVGVGDGEDFVGEREVGFGLGAPELPGGGVVGFGGLLRRVEGSQPDTALLGGIPNLGGVATPWPLPHVSEVLIHLKEKHSPYIHQTHDRTCHVPRRVVAWLPGE